MSFYESLYPFYDRIFPLNKQAESFIAAHFSEGDTLLDIGAGTGNLAIALAEKGLKLTAIEPEEAMANDIRSKANAKGVSVTVKTKTMEQVELLNGDFDGICCVGNTLPHLQSIGEIESFLEKCYMKLKNDGTFILQTVNFEKFFASSDFSFPVIAKEDFKFERKYERDGEKVLFTTTLTNQDESFTNSIPLFPVTSTQIHSILKRIGYGEIHVYGNFKGEEHSVNSPAIVVLAKKSV